MLPSVGWSLYYRDGQWPAWTGSILIVGAIGGILWAIGHGSKAEVLQREAVAITGLGWIVAAATGAIPFLMTGTVDSYGDAYFETMSGYTTTGSTILGDIEAVAPSVLFWRSMTHWLGGIGIIVLFIAILPFFSRARRRLYRTELPGVSVDGLTPRIRQTVVAMVKIYLALSIAECLLLWAHPGMSLFDALCHTFGTMATGGFSTRNASIGHYQSVYIEAVVILFMFLAGCNFTLHFFFGQGRWLIHWRDVEFRTYAAVLAAATAIVTLLVWGSGEFGGAAGGLAAAFRAGIFSVVSIMTTTGFVTDDFDRWPNVCRGLLVLLMFIGGCGGSTGGGIKVVRFLVAFRALFAQIERHHTPRAVRQVKLGGRVLDDQLQFSVLGFFFAAMVISGVATVVLAALEPGLDLVSAFTSVAATLNNIGPGLERVGAVESYRFLSGSSKWLLSLCMLMGRLELFSILVLFAPRFWREG
jgi:trk system potassium uptake protein TrkH